jgi:hypothetical protein
VIPAAWYPDPYDPRLQRWWDGTQWTPYTQPLGGDPRQDLDSELNTGRQARGWLLVAVTSDVLLFFVIAITYGPSFRKFFDAVRNSAHAAPGTTTPPPHLGGAFALIELLSLGRLVAGVIFVVWLYKAAQLARRAGIPATFEPYWAILGFVIPFISLWFPYLVARDCLPPGHPGRRTVGRWWALYLTMSFSSIPIIVMSFVSVPIAIALAFVASGVAISAVIAARDVIAVVGRAHSELLGARSV